MFRLRQAPATVKISMSAQRQTARKLDENGYLTVKGCPISSFGIFDYGAGQLGLPGDPNRIVKVFRPESAVNDPATIDSFKNVPFIVDHEMLSGFDDDDVQENNEGVAPEEKGIDGILTSNVYYDSPWMRGDLVIYSRKAKQALAKSKKDLSLGYSCDFELTPGVFDGQSYEVIQKNMRGNHIALVDEGRVPGARVLDGLVFDHLNFDVRPSDEDSHMSKGNRSKAADNAVEQLQALIPALQQFLAQEGKEPEHQGEGGSSETDMGPIEADGGAGAEESGADPAGDPAPAAAEGSEGGGQLGQLLDQVEAIIAQLRASIGSSGASDEEGMSGEGAAEGEGQTTDESEADDHVEDTAAKDNGEGNAEENNGRASPGPAAGKHTGADAATLRRFYADSALKNRLYDRLSKVVGAFPHATMDSRQVAVYGVKKLQATGALKGIKPGTEHIALDAYLTGVEAATKKHRSTVQTAVRAKTGDSAVIPSTDAMDDYLARSN